MRLRFRLQQPTKKVEFPMAPLIAVMFQFLFFFMLNLTTFNRDGDLNSRLPVTLPALARPPLNISSIKVGIRSDRDGNLTQLSLGSKNLGSDDAAFDRLNGEILAMIGRPGNPLASDIEVEIDADFETQYKYVVKAISKCTGRFDPDTKQVARYIEKIRFAPPHKPKA